MFRRLRQRNLIAASAIAVTLSLPASAAAADFYVDDDSGNNAHPCTTQAAPCQTVASALAKADAVPGSADEIHVDGGAYNADNVKLGMGDSLREQNFNTGDSDNQAVIATGASGGAIRVAAGEPAGTIEGFDFVRGAGGGEMMGAIYLLDEATVTANTITGMTSGVGGATTGIAVHDASPTIRDNVLTSGAGGGGYGISIGGNSSPTVSQNTLSGLHYAVIQVGGTGATTISQNTITGASNPLPNPDTAGINLQSGGTTTITGNSISSPAQPNDAFNVGVVLAGFSAPTSATLARNRVSGQTHAFRAIDATLTLNSDIAYDNTKGLSAYSDPGNPVYSIDARNVTFFDNERAGFGTKGDIGLGGDIALALDSSLLESPIEADPESACSISFSRGPTTSGTPCQRFQTTAAPGFVNPATGDYHLGPLSPMIDAGNPIAPVAPNHQDFDGDPRAQDGDCQPAAVRDIGADEAGPRTAACDPPGVDTDPPDRADVDPPETTLTKKPRKRVETDDERVKAKFAFNSDEPGSGFDCKLDKGPYKPCDSGRLKRKVNTGRHRFLVRATDAAGNADPTPARARWKVVAG